MASPGDFKGLTFVEEIKDEKMSKTIFITGASSGLGKATAKLFAAKGWTVIATLRNPEKETELSQLPNVHLLQLDICNASQIRDIAAKAEQISSVDVLYNNAGYALGGDLEATSTEQIQRQINTNFLGTILVTKAFLPYFKKRKDGIIISTSSIAAYIPEPFIAVYAATKAALEMWTASMSFELEKVGVSIKTIVPSSMQTSFLGNADMAFEPDYQTDFNNYMGKLMSDVDSVADKPEDIAKVVYGAVTDDNKQLYYFAGNDAIQKCERLKKEGLESVMADTKRLFFE
ncbi:SDR family oxidoreductase [Sphingobacterium shayense]|uniref:SDR family oxidoreductase n=1 Tax=Sphingobacterium shayense TaxID=626343 RepID=UPI001FEA6138|nr:SDR family oxidoreductase [Sphingobacterium shayense]